MFHLSSFFVGVGEVALIYIQDDYDLAQLLHTPTAAYAFKELENREG